MSNQQLFPSSIYPSSGDLQTTPGSPNTTVVGLQTVPIVNTAPTTGQVLAYLNSKWTPAGSLSDNDSISVNGTTVSDDYLASINRIDTDVQVNSSYSPHGFPILAAGSAVNTP